MAITIKLSRAVEAVLRERDESGDWTDADESLLAAWREARGLRGLQRHRWFIKPLGEDLYQLDYASQADALAGGRSEYDGAAFEIICARLWADDIRVEDALFAHATGHEIIPAVQS